MLDYSREYYEARRSKSLDMAAAAIKPQIAAIHRKLAEEYDRILSAMPDGDTAAAPKADPSPWRPALKVAAG